MRGEGRFSEEEQATIFGAGGASPVASVVAGVSGALLWTWLMDWPPAPSF
jgi:hypothetical protein